jgi:hypothetical protein
VITAILVTIAIVLPVGILWGGALERDRRARFATLADNVPPATATARQRRQWARERLDLNAGLRWRS